MHGKVAIVRGGASGIGRAWDERFAWRGARLTLADLNAAAAQRVAQDFRAADARAIAVDAAGIVLDPDAA